MLATPFSRFLLFPTLSFHFPPLSIASLPSLHFSGSLITCFILIAALFILFIFPSLLAFPELRSFHSPPIVPYLETLNVLVCLIVCLCVCYECLSVCFFVSLSVCHFSCVYVSVNEWMDVCMYLCVYLCMYRCIYIYEMAVPAVLSFMSVCPSFCLSACMHSFLCVCMNLVSVWCFSASFCIHVLSYSCWYVVCMYICMEI